MAAVANAVKVRKKRDELGRERGEQKRERAERELALERSNREKLNAQLLSSSCSRPPPLCKTLPKQTEASYNTIAETAEWQALQEHVAEIDKTCVLN